MSTSAEKKVVHHGQRRWTVSVSDKDVSDVLIRIAKSSKGQFALTASQRRKLSGAAASDRPA
jgi:hypothetical protein